ncbi:hypothetical protein D9613_003597 [Agrocybe pediades]|uniref:F-box domain-containing protein n=1 Tax=Agrocybe pediades TaxID=84607 RepID=A0A8H4QIY6_9AGAR|nr:hypothetical protein D9613_003597 [Agrocybe pediades]
MAKPRRRGNKRRKQARSALPLAAGLPADILWKIIDIISRGRSPDPGHHTITYIRHISQVCRLWREVTLQSTSVWGNMIDINFLSRASEEWKSEIMRRTGRAGLSISGSLVPSREGTPDTASPTLTEIPNPATPILVDLLEHDWERVVALRLVFQTFEEGPLRDVLKIFWTKPALILEEFSIAFMFDSAEPVSIPPGAVIFLDNAPHLRSFCWQGLHSDLRAGWVKQLSQLYLPQVCSVQRALDIIRECPRLQKLTYDSHILHSAELVLEKVNLPELCSLNLKADFTACSALLTYITPNPACLLKWTYEKSTRLLPKI